LITDAPHLVSEWLRRTSLVGVGETLQQSAVTPDGIPHKTVMMMSVTRRDFAVWLKTKLDRRNNQINLAERNRQGFKNDGGHRQTFSKIMKRIHENSDD